MNYPLPTDEQLHQMDDRLARESVPATKRPDVAMWQWIRSVGAIPPNLAELASWFVAKFSAMHPSVNFKHRPFAYLCVSARGISYELNPPVVFGAPRKDPIDSIRIQRSELERIYKLEPSAFWELYYQAADGMDLFLADLDFHPTKVEAKEMLAVGTGQLEAVARQLVACVEDASLAQAVCLAVEMVAKAVICERGGASDDELKALGHRLPVICEAITTRFPGDNDHEFLNVARKMPNYVAVRYRPPPMKIRDAQELYRRSLFLSAEVMRRTRGHNVYPQLVQDPTVPDRIW